MSDGSEWFAPKRYGYGAGRPIAWQGWAVTTVFIAGAVVAANVFAVRPLILASILVPATLVVLLIAARTTRGGWRWRWGDPD
jgi:hypothetical protein